MQRRSWLLIITLLTALACVYVALTGSLGDFGSVPAGDYPGPACLGCDSAEPPLVALVHGNVSEFFSRQPVMGSVSLLLRAPFLALVTWAHGDYVAQYRVGVLVCLLASALLLLPAVNLMLRRGQPVVAVVLLAAILLGPVTFKEVVFGHPEESLGAALAVAAVLAAARGRGLTAGLLVGLTIATKQWGVFALAPVLMLARGQRRQVAAGTAGVLLLFVLPMFVADPARFMNQNGRTAAADLGVTPTNLWWSFHQPGFDPSVHHTINVIPGWLDALTHPIAFACAAGVSLLYWRRSADRDQYDALALLALLFLLRCVLDPLTISYHHAPFLLTIAVYEGLSRRGLPVVTLISSAVILSLSRLVAPLGQPDLMNAVYLGWALTTTAYLASHLLRRPEPHFGRPVSPRATLLAGPTSHTWSSILSAPGQR